MAIGVGNFEQRIELLTAASQRVAVVLSQGSLAQPNAALTVSGSFCRGLLKSIRSTYIQYGSISLQRAVKRLLCLPRQGVDSGPGLARHRTVLRFSVSLSGASSICLLCATRGLAGTFREQPVTTRWRTSENSGAKRFGRSLWSANAVERRSERGASGGSGRRASTLRCRGSRCSLPAPFGFLEGFGLPPR